MTKKQSDYIYRQTNKEKVRNCNKAYRHSFKGRIVHMYQSMHSRVTYSINTKYYGLELLSKQAFYDFAFSSEEFKELYDNWVNSDFDNKLNPSINRINPKVGYIIGNIEFILNIENQRLGGYGKRGYRKYEKEMDKQGF